MNGIQVPGILQTVPITVVQMFAPHKQCRFGRTESSGVLVWLPRIRASVELFLVEEDNAVSVDGSGASEVVALWSNSSISSQQANSQDVAN